jgi:hypothetical protein
MRISVTFDEVKFPVTRCGKCPICNKKVIRRTTLTNTLSPFNKNPDGSVRTHQEILNHLAEMAKDWEPDFYHQNCRS